MAHASSSDKEDGVLSLKAKRILPHRLQATVDDLTWIISNARMDALAPSSASPTSRPHQDVRAVRHAHAHRDAHLMMMIKALAAVLAACPLPTLSQAYSWIVIVDTRNKCGVKNEMSRETTPCACRANTVFLADAKGAGLGGYADLLSTNGDSGFM